MLKVVPGSESSEREKVLVEDVVVEVRLSFWATRETRKSISLRDIVSGWSLDLSCLMC